MKTLSQICKDGRFTILISPLLLLTSVLPLSAASPNLLWEIGKADNDDREFALAPNGYTKFKEDGFFVAGRSQAKQDWPYVQPGPDDGWAGGRPHVFTVLFGVQSAPTAGDCKLRLDLVDTQGRDAAGAEDRDQRTDFQEEDAARSRGRNGLRATRKRARNTKSKSIFRRRSCARAGTRSASRRCRGAGLFMTGWGWKRPKE